MTAVVRANNMEDDGFVGGIVLVAVRLPSARAEVQLDRTAKVVASGIENGADEIRPRRTAGHAREYHLQPAAVFQAQWPAKPRSPAGGELSL
jgi:hypothetical protein